MPLGDSVSISAIKTETGLSTINNVSGLNTDATINAYSYWSPKGLYFNPSNYYQIETVTDTSPYSMGDFRRYDHGALTPTMALGNSSLTLAPSATSAPFVVIWSNKYMNFKRADSTNSITRVGVTAFSTLTAAQNYISSGGTGRVLLNNSGYVYLENISFISTDITLGSTTYAVSPALSDHVVTQTSYPAVQYVGTSGGIGVDVSGLAAGGSATYYIRMDFYNSNISNTYDTIRGNLSGNILTLNVAKQSNPYVQVFSLLQPSGTNVFAVSLDYSSNTIGATSISFNFRVANSNSTTYSNTYCLRYKAPDGTTTLVSGQQTVSYTAAAFGGTTGTLVTVSGFTLPASRTWNYGAGSNAQYLFEVDWDGNNGCF